MQLIESSTKIVSATPDALELIEYAGRTCYQSRGKIKGPLERHLFIQNLIVRGHESPLEHASITVNMVCSRITQQQWTRHRIAAYSIESRRYNVYKDGVTYIIPAWCKNIEPGEYNYYTFKESTLYTDQENHFIRCLLENERGYLHGLEEGLTGEESSQSLSLCLKSEMVVTHNFREWRHILKERTKKCCSEDMYLLARKITLMLASNYKVVFNDIINWED